MASRPSGKMLKSLPPDPARHQDSAITLVLAPEQNKKVSTEVLGMVKAMAAEAKNPTSNVSWQEAEDADHISIERKLSAQRGKWRIMSAENEARATKQGD